MGAKGSQTRTIPNDLTYIFAVLFITPFVVGPR